MQEVVNFPFFFHLCDELIFEIFLFHLDIQSILSCRLVCYHFFSVLSDLTFWRQRTSELSLSSSIFSHSHLLISHSVSLLCKLEYTRQWVLKYLHDQLSLAGVKTTSVDPNTCQPIVINIGLSVLSQIGVGAHLRVLRYDGTYDHAIASEFDADDVLNVVFFSACGHYELNVSQREIMQSGTPPHGSKIGSYKKLTFDEWVGDDKENISLIICQPRLSRTHTVTLANMTLDNVERPTATGGHAHYWSSALFAYWCQTGHLCLTFDLEEKMEAEEQHQNI